MALPDEARAIWMEGILARLAAHDGPPPSLQALAEDAGMSPEHFQRTFTRWAGLSPKRLLTYRAVQTARQHLEDNQTVLDAAFASGLSGPGRLHDQCVQLLAATPGEVKNGGAGIVFAYGVHPTPLGRVFLGVTERGIAALAFLSPSRSSEAALADLRRNWPAADFVEDLATTRSWTERVFAAFPRRGDPVPFATPLPVFVRGTQFQVRVWEALLQIPAGEVTTYGALAHQLETPKGSRAVGQAVGRNPVSLLIPCHRVIRESGLLGGYRWGLGVKKLILAQEAS